MNFAPGAFGQSHARLATTRVVAIAESYAGVFQDQTNVSGTLLMSIGFCSESASNELMTEKIIPPPKKGASKPGPARRPEPRDSTPKSDERIHPPRDTREAPVPNPNGEEASQS